MQRRWVDSLRIITAVSRSTLLDSVGPERPLQGIVKLPSSRGCLHFSSISRSCCSSACAFATYRAYSRCAVVRLLVEETYSDRLDETPSRSRLLCRRFLWRLGERCRPSACIVSFNSISNSFFSTRTPRSSGPIGGSN